MVDLDQAYMSATEIAEAIRGRKLSALEVTTNSLARIAQVNAELNCFCFVYPDEALAAARKADEAVARGDKLGRLHGVPIAFKDMTPTAGKRTTLGSYAFEHWVPDHNAAIVDRLLAEGAIMVGKTTTSELAYSFITDTKLWGATKNPWNTGHTPGGSSGGSAAAVASGCLPLAEGCDMGGSVRLPASFCGLVGLKPSFGRIPFDILPSQFDTFCHFGPLARTVADAALFLALAMGPDDRDFSSLPSLDDIRVPPEDDVRGLRLALSLDLGYYAVDEEVSANTLHAADTLRELGAHVEQVEIPWTREISEAGWIHWDVYTALIIGDRFEEFRDRMDATVVASVERGRRASALDFKRVDFTRTKQWQAVAPIFETFDALLCPTTALPALPIGVNEDEFGGDDPQGRFQHFEMTFPFNMLSACPAMSVPSGFNAAGLPTGLQIVGRRHDDAMVLRIGNALERSMNWRQARPDL
jgi:Asp-tRNA(Asn)/Glu-tRNA(Gln) amidotransferase A subunit family amidase